MKNLIASRTGLSIGYNNTFMAGLSEARKNLDEAKEQLKEHKEMIEVLEEELKILNSEEEEQEA